MKKIFYLSLILLLSGNLSYSQVKVNWVSIEEADKLLKSDPKPIFIDAFTDWCGWCKKFDKNTFSHPLIAEYLNTNFISVKFNAESKKALTFLGTEFINDGKAGKAHQLAVALLQGNMQYPTVAFFNKEGEFLGPVAGYKEALEFEALLTFIAEEKYLNENWIEYQKTFEGKVK